MDALNELQGYQQMLWMSDTPTKKLSDTERNKHDVVVSLYLMDHFCFVPDGCDGRFTYALSLGFSNKRNAAYWYPLPGLGKDLFSGGISTLSPSPGMPPIRRASLTNDGANNGCFPLTKSSGFKYDCCP
jgi:hypothetical protein